MCRAFARMTVWPNRITTYGVLCMSCMLCYVAAVLLELISYFHLLAGRASPGRCIADYLTVSEQPLTMLAPRYFASAGR